MPDTASDYKTLLVLRHAKSSWSDPDLADYKRPLNKRGQRDAPRMGEAIARLGYVPDVVYCSTAHRTQLTAKYVVEAMGFTGEVIECPLLYMGSVLEYLETVREAPDSVNRLMLVGHNPTCEMLIERLTGHVECMPTAALAVITLPITRWTDLSNITRGSLELYLTPKTLPA